MFKVNEHAHGDKSHLKSFDLSEVVDVIFNAYTSFVEIKFISRVQDYSFH